MNEVLQSARKLADAITQSNEYREYQDNKAVLESKDLLQVVPLLEQATSIVADENFSKEDKLYIDALEVISKYSGDTEIDIYIKSKKALELMLSAVNGTLAHVTGMDTSSSKCGGCSGCHSK